TDGTATSPFLALRAEAKARCTSDRTSCKSAQTTSPNDESSKTSSNGVQRTPFYASGRLMSLTPSSASVLKNAEALNPIAKVDVAGSTPVSRSNPCLPRPMRIPMWHDRIRSSGLPFNIVLEGATATIERDPRGRLNIDGIGPCRPGRDVGRGGRVFSRSGRRVFFDDYRGS